MHKKHRSEFVKKGIAHDPFVFLVPFVAKFFLEVLLPEKSSPAAVPSPPRDLENWNGRAATTNRF
jgi:hypothetical protein